MTPPDQRPAEGPDLKAIRRWFTITVLIGVSVGVIITLATGGRAVLAAALQMPLGWLMLALTLSALSWLAQGFGFAALSTRGIKGNLLRMTSAFLGGDFAALTTPFGSGGIPAGVFCLTREGLTPGESSAIVAMHSLLTGLFFLVIGALAAIVMPLQTRGAEAVVWSGIAAIGVVLVFVVWLARRPRAAAASLHKLLSSRWLTKILGAKRQNGIVATIDREATKFAGDVETLMHERPSQLVLSFLGLFISRVFIMLCLPIVMYGLGYRGALLPIMAIAIGAGALAIVSPTPGGSGAVEAATAALLATQAPAALAGAATLVWRSVDYYAELSVGWIVFTRYLAMKPPMPVAHPSEVEAASLRD
jgi:glycosyltransferase 2 family protein